MVTSERTIMISEPASKDTAFILPAIPAKRYFTIGEVSDLCGVKTHVLRYWEQEFTQLKPVKRRGNRRYYQHHEVLLIRRIRELLYEEGLTISGARNRLDNARMENGHGAAEEKEKVDAPARPVGRPPMAPARAPRWAARRWRRRAIPTWPRSSAS